MQLHQVRTATGILESNTDRSHMQHGLGIACQKFEFFERPSGRRKRDPMRKFVIGLVVSSVVLIMPAALAQAPETTPATSAAPAASSSMASEAPRTYLEKAIIVVDGKAEYNGSVQFEFTPLGAAGTTFVLTVLAKSGKKDIANDIIKELLIAAGSLYKVKLSGAEVRVSKASKAAKNFSIVIRKLNVSGVSVLAKKG